MTPIRITIHHSSQRETRVFIASKRKRITWKKPISRLFEATVSVKPAIYLRQPLFCRNAAFDCDSD